MDDVFVHSQAEVAADGAGCGLCAVGGAHELAHGGDGVLAGDNHLDHGAGGDVGDQALVEGLALVLAVVGLGLLHGDHAQLHALDGEADALDAGDDLSDVAVADAVGLDHVVSLLDGHLSGSFHQRAFIAWRRSAAGYYNPRASARWGSTARHTRCSS